MLPIATLAASQTALLTAIAGARNSINAMFVAQINLTSNLGNKWTTARAQALTIQANANAYLTLAQGNIDASWKTQIMTESQATANAILAQMLADGDTLAAFVTSGPFDPTVANQQLAGVLSDFDRLANELINYQGWIAPQTAAGIAANRTMAGLS
jgi:hypothetical protein